jgi:ligand-binding sensor domain-containing protein
MVNDWINTLVEDKEGNIWMGTFWGLSKLDPDNGVFTNFLSGDSGAEKPE